MRTSDASLLQDVIQVARDGASFYESAGADVKSAELRDTFAQMARHKRELISALGAQLRGAGENVPTSGTIAGNLRKAYTDVRATISSNDEKTYVAQLEQTEDRLLKHVTDAIADATDTGARAKLEGQLPAVRRCHEIMRDLKHRLQ